MTWNDDTSRRRQGDAALGLKIRKLRGKFQLSQDALAYLLGRSESWVYKVEKGTAEPTYLDLVRLGEIFDVAPTHFFHSEGDRHTSDVADDGRQSRLVGPPNGGMIESDVRRVGNDRHELLEAGQRLLAVLQRLSMSSHSPSLVGAPPAGQEPSAVVMSTAGQVLDGLVALTRNYVHLHNTVPPSAVRPAIVRHFEDLTAMALRSHAPSTAARLRSMAAQTGILAGWVAFNLQDLSQALMYWVVAHDLAREAGNLSLQAHALGARSRLFSPIHRDRSEADPAAALALLDQAVRLSRHAASPALRSWLLANRAQQYAATAQGDASSRDLEAAAQLASLREQAEDDVLSGWDEVRVDAYRGTCAMVLGRPSEVIAVTESVLERTDPKRVQWSLQRSDLAAAYALRGEVEQACGLLGEALTAARHAEFPEGVRRALGVRSAYLADHADAQAVLQLDQLIAAGRESLVDQSG